MDSMIVSGLLGCDLVLVVIIVDVFCVVICIYYGCDECVILFVMLWIVRFVYLDELIFVIIGVLDIMVIIGNSWYYFGVVIWYGDFVILWCFYCGYVIVFLYGMYDVFLWRFVVYLCVIFSENLLIFLVVWDYLYLFWCGWIVKEFWKLGSRDLVEL